jgi:hypothetical protein
VLGGLAGDEDGIGVGSAAGPSGDVAAGVEDPVEGRTVDDEVADHREGLRPPRLDGDLVAVREVAHVELADRAPLPAVGDAVDHEAARAADALPAVVVEGDGLLALRR